MNSEIDKQSVTSPGPAAAHIPLTAMFFRSFLLQAGWNYERFQNLGFVFSLIPALRSIYPDREKLKGAVLRHMEIFNTQPYMANFVLGNVARMEESAAAMASREGEDTAPLLKNMPGVKQALASSFASIGDRIFWGRLKPITTQLCLLCWALCGFFGWLFTGLADQPPLWLLFAGPLAGMLCYSAVAISLRWLGLARGYECGGKASCGLDSVNWPRQISLLSTIGFALSITLAIIAVGLLAGLNYGGCFSAGMLLKLCIIASVLALHRITRAFGRSVFYAAGFILAVSVLLFSGLKLEPINLYL